MGLTMMWNMITLHQPFILSRFISKLLGLFLWKPVWKVALSPKVTARWGLELLPKSNLLCCPRHLTCCPSIHTSSPKVISYKCESLQVVKMASDQCYVVVYWDQSQTLSSGKGRKLWCWILYFLLCVVLYMILFVLSQCHLY